MGEWTNNDYGREYSQNQKTFYNLKTPLYGGLYEFRNQSCKTNKTTIDLSKMTPRIQVFRGFLNIANVEECRIGLYELRTGKTQYIYGFYNKRNGKYYISFDQIQKDIKRQFFYDIHMIPSNYGSKQFDNSYYDFNEFSLLKLYGYSVGKNGLSKENRRLLLVHLMDNKIMNPFEITKHLQGLIALREHRNDRDFTHAIIDWKEDIQFVRDYRINKTSKNIRMEIA